MTDDQLATMTGPEKRTWVLDGGSGQERARRLMHVLRGPGGCPWDLEQTHASLRKYVLEEAYELADAIDSCEPGGDVSGLEEELGDVYLQVLFHARIAEQVGTMSIDSVSDRLVHKMITRHPHVFEVEATRASSTDVLSDWEKSKRRTKKTDQKFGHGLPRAMPALQRAQILSSRAAHMGFDWVQAQDVICKLEEEILELKSAMNDSDLDAAQAELGDLLFAATNVARKMGWDAEKILDSASEKFRHRFEFVLELRESGSTDAPVSADQWASWWAAAKRAEQTVSGVPHG